MAMAVPSGNFPLMMWSSKIISFSLDKCKTYKTYSLQVYAFKGRRGWCDYTVSVPRSHLSFSQIFLKGRHKEKGRRKKGGRTLDIRKKRNYVKNIYLLLWIYGSYFLALIFIETTSTKTNHMRFWNLPIYINA